MTSFLKRRKVKLGQQTERVFMQKQPSEGFFKKRVIINFAEFTRKHLYRNPFLVFSCEFCKICKNTFFAEQHQTTASDYSSINTSEGSTANETELRDKN